MIDNANFGNCFVMVARRLKMRFRNQTTAVVRLVMEKPAGNASARHQFTLLSLFELTTVCALLSAAIPLLGLQAAASLMLFAAALNSRLGWLALLSLIATILLASGPSGLNADTTSERQAIALLASTLICAWYWRRHMGRSLIE
jgi:hypothetical protein